MALELLEESFVHQYSVESNALMSHLSDPLKQCNTSEWPDWADLGYLLRIDRGSTGFLLLLVMLIGGIPSASLAQSQVQQDVSQPMQELQDQWREIMKKEYNPSANQVIQPAQRPAPAPSFEPASQDVNTDSGRSGSLEASGQGLQPARNIRARSGRTQRSSGSIGRSKSPAKRGSGRVSGTAGRTRGKGLASSNQPSRDADRSGTVERTQTRNSTTQVKAQAAPAKSIQAEKPAPAKERKAVAGKSTESSVQKPVVAKGAVSNQQKAAPADSSGSGQKKRAAATAAVSGKSNKKSGR